MRLKFFLSLLMVFVAGVVISAFLSTTLQLIGLGLILGIFTICWIHFIRGYQWMYTNLRTGLVFILGYSLMFLPISIVVNAVILVLVCLILYIAFLYKKVVNEEANFGLIIGYHDAREGPSGEMFTWVRYDVDDNSSVISDTAGVDGATKEDIEMMKRATHVETHLFYQKIGEKIVFEKKDLVSKLLAIFEDRILKKIKI